MDRPSGNGSNPTSLKPFSSVRHLQHAAGEVMNAVGHDDVEVHGLRPVAVEDLGAARSEIVPIVVEK
jgi:hypothetical protein